MLLMEKEREIRALQDRCRELETKNTSLQEERDQMLQDREPGSPEIGAYKVSTWRDTCTLLGGIPARWAIEGTPGLQGESLKKSRAYKVHSDLL